LRVGWVDRPGTDAYPLIIRVSPERSLQAPASYPPSGPLSSHSSLVWQIGLKRVTKLSILLVTFSPLYSSALGSFVLWVSCGASELCRHILPLKAFYPCCSGFWFLHLLCIILPLSLYDWMQSLSVSLSDSSHSIPCALSAVALNTTL